MERVVDEKEPPAKHDGYQWNPISQKKMRGKAIDYRGYHEEGCHHEEAESGDSHQREHHSLKRSIDLFPRNSPCFLMKTEESVRENAPVCHNQRQGAHQQVEHDRNNPDNLSHEGSARSSLYDLDEGCVKKGSAAADPFRTFRLGTPFLGAQTCSARKRRAGNISRRKEGPGRLEAPCKGSTRARGVVYDMSLTPIDDKLALSCSEDAPVKSCRGKEIP